MRDGAAAPRRRTRGGTDAGPVANPEAVIAYLREHGITLTYDPVAGILRAGGDDAKTTIMKAS